MSNRNVKEKTRNKDAIFKGIWWSCVFFIGFIFYLIAYLQYQETDELTFIIYSIIRSIEASLKLFIFNFHYDTPVQNIVDNNKLYFIAIVVNYIFAILWTSFIAITLIFKNIMNKLKIWCNAHFPQRKDKYHYIIVGCENAMQTFLSDLRKTTSKNKITIITGIPVSFEKDNSSIYNEFIEEGYAVIKGIASEKMLVKAGVNSIRRRTRVIAITESDEQNLAIAEIITKKIFWAIFDKEVKKYGSKEKYLNFLEMNDIDFLNITIESLTFKPKSNTEYNNLSNEEKRKEDLKKEIKEILLGNIKKINLEAFIMYSFIERTEHFAFAENAFGKVDYFNPYELRARAFFKENPITKYILHFIDTDKARLKGDYKDDGRIYKNNGSNCIIKNIFIGFGHTNYQMLKGNILTNQLLGCNYIAKIYDQNITSTNEMMFKNHSSGLFGYDETIKDEKYYSSPKEEYIIDFKNKNVLSKCFYINNDDCITNDVINSDFSIIFIALGDNKLNIETACEIRQCLYEHNITQEKVRIFVKICEESVFSTDIVLNNPKNIPIKIECFGYTQMIFTKENIINETIDSFTKMIANKNHDKPWEFLNEIERDINRHLAISIKSKLNLLGFDLSDEKDNNSCNIDYYNAYRDESDKILEIIRLSKEIADKRNRKEVKNSINEKIEERKQYILEYIQKDNDRNIIDNPRNNLARLEHLRWNTFHLIHGWTKMPISKVDKDNNGRKNILTKQHACITTFEDLLKLRELQAENLIKNDKENKLSRDDALRRADTIWYDYNLMDELPVRLEGTDKYITEFKKV